MRPQLKFAAALALLAACGEGPLDPGAFTLRGQWIGRGFPYELALNLDQDGANRVDGDGEIRSLRQRLETDTISLDPLVTDTVLLDTVIVDRVAVEVLGDWDYPDFVLTLRAADYADAQYEGRFGGTSPDSIGGTLRGSGFPDVSIPLVRVLTP
ncbi:hypothetical protein [Longimicrobium sp.]|uniref:hypothetical protein n=1 Tax=Longimicrobium sp. TaxID=2029185 RepID=UPI002E2F3E1C|nr:hypothetical protein [Longimicrobium sp.]HEX6041998.1 hypothetical protein [Longimicrobium sp.]